LVHVVKNKLHGWADTPAIAMDAWKHALNPNKLQYFNCLFALQKALGGRPKADQPEAWDMAVTPWLKSIWQVQCRITPHKGLQ
jgi:hypothetical protein